MEMLIIPAIDLLQGKAVRLKQGDMNKFKEYFNNPVDAAKIFADDGIKRMHIVDLDGAKTGDTVNFQTIEKIATDVDIDIEVGGGIRNIKRIEAYFNIGVKYAILGTSVIKDPEFVKEALEEFPNRIILGIDAKDGYVATDGWYEKSNLSALEAINTYNDYKAESIIYTDIARDGMLQGLNIKNTIELANKTVFPVIASGGLKDINDIIALKGQKNILGCIVGKAFYEGKLDLKQAIDVAGE
jgi:phosphoribosylformimino-5-aminoimidazole carboxamide ribotide isomerase